MGAPQPVHNGWSAPSESLGPRGLIDRHEYVRVLEQALRALGYGGVAEQLELESCICQQPPQATAFRAAVLSGSYDAAVQLLPSVAADVEVMERARFLLIKQKYTEGVLRGDTAAALQVLRQELQPLRVQQHVLHSLAALLLQSPAAVAAAGPSTPAVGASGCGASSTISSGNAVSAERLAEGRAVLLDELQDSLMPSLLIPERRLEELVEQALMSQLNANEYHNSCHTHLSLFSDYQAGAEQLPTQPSQVLEEHSSEVWCITFSQDGRWAASASKDGTALLWPVTGSGRFEAPRQLAQQEVPCQLVAFSPDSQLILVASMDCSVRLFDVAACTQLRQFSVGDNGQQAVVAVSWFPDSRQFLAATHKQLGVYDAGQEGGGGPQRRLPPSHTYIYDAVVGPGGSCVISVGQDRRIAFHRLSDQRVEFLTESGTVTSLHLSTCGRFLTANLSDSLVHIWHLPPGLAAQHPGATATANGAVAVGSMGGGELGGGSSGAFRPLRHGPAAAAGSPAVAGGDGSDGGPACAPADPLDALPTAPLHEFRMAAGPSRYVLRSCVGGATSGFVACGSEDCRLYIWSRISGELLEAMQGHTGCINAVAWSPRNAYLLASASDDGSIRTWLAPAARR